MLIFDNRNAEEKWYSRFTKAAKDNYCEMGLISFSVVCYMRKNGQLAVDMYVFISFVKKAQITNKPPVMRIFLNSLGSLASHSSKCMNRRPQKLCEQSMSISKRSNQVVHLVGRMVPVPVPFWPAKEYSISNWIPMAIRLRRPHHHGIKLRREI